MRKLNSRLEFPRRIDLGRFLARGSDRSKSAAFLLFGVLVHAGSPTAGHYYAFLRPGLAERWFRFNDSAVAEVPSQQAVEDNYGSNSFSAYMLIYVPEEDVGRLFVRVPAAAISVAVDVGRRPEMAGALQLITDDTITTPARRNRFSLRHLTGDSVIFDLRKSEHEFYEKVTELLHVHECHIYSVGQTVRVLDDGQNQLPKDSRMFYVDTDCVRESDSFFVLVFVYNTKCRPPVRFLKALSVAEDEENDSIKERIRVDDHVWVIDPDVLFRPRLRLLDSSMRCWQGGSIIFESYNGEISQEECSAFFYLHMA
jgi:hypothetical protein